MTKTQTQPSKISPPVKKLPKTTESSKSTYKILLVANNEKYNSEGETILEAFRSFPIHYTKIKTKGTVTVTHGKYEIERFFPGIQLRRLLVNSLLQKFWSEQIEKNFKILKEKKVFKQRLNF